jgi:hypothetical protein
MWSPLSFEAGHSVIFGTVALHNRGLRIIRHGTQQATATATPDSRDPYPILG